jgi:hypothetical protein
MGEPPGGPSSSSEGVGLSCREGVSVWNGYHSRGIIARTYEFFAGVYSGAEQQISRHLMSFIRRLSIAGLGNKYMVFTV